MPIILGSSLFKDYITVILLLSLLLVLFVEEEGDGVISDVAVV
jgi:hypothetical protein